MILAALCQLADLGTFLLFVGPDREGGALAGQPVAAIIAAKLAGIAVAITIVYVLRHRWARWPALIVAFVGIVGATTNLGAI